MKKILYITHVNKSNSSHKGFEKKIINQKQAMNSIENNTCDLIYIEGYEVYIEYSSGKKQHLFTMKNKFERTLTYYKKLKNNIKWDLYDVIYIRYPLSKPDLLNLLKHSKQNGKKNIVEIVTYPYDGELKNANGLSLVKKQLDLYYRKKLKKYVDKIVTFSSDLEIFDIPCINISNGINLEQLTLIEKKQLVEKVVFTSVSACEHWHGIDRFLNSLDYYLEQNPIEKCKFKLNIVGEGVETTNLKEIVSESKYLSEVVVFHGFKSGEELDQIYNETDIAVGSLGRHRSGLTSLKTLKNREYAAKGLPMIYSEIDTDFEEQLFVNKVTPDEEVIDLAQIITWHQNLKTQPEEIREYAKQFSWDTQMKKVIDAIEAK